ncbi:MAG: hypothetical protein EOP40_03585 [Rubrivivax sp.]|nr:MAG: hypothetical protein EOP40_03585 [Rubrivivax sp.]
MADKYLTESEWKNFCKKPGYKAELLVKALAGLEKADKAGPQAQLKALDELDKQADVLLKANKADKILSGYLGEMAKAGKKLRKEADDALAKAKSSSKDDDDDEDGPPAALLDPKKLLAQLNLCKRDSDRTVQFAFVDAKDKQDAALAMSPKVAGRSLFAKLQQAAGVKTGAYGSAWIDGTALMLQLDKPLGGLVKKIRGPVKACGFKISKVVLWNEDGTVFEQEDEPEDKAAPASGDAPAAKPAAPTAKVGAAGADAAVDFDTRLKTVVKRLEALKATGAEGIREIVLKVSEAGVWSRKKELNKAEPLLAEAEAMLEKVAAPSGAAGKAAGAAVPGAGAPKPATAAGDPVAAFSDRLGRAVRGVQALKAAGSPLLAEAAGKLKKADAVGRAKAFDQANELLDEVEQLIKQGAAPGKAAPAGGTPASGTSAGTGTGTGAAKAAPQPAADDEADDILEPKIALQRYAKARGQVLGQLDLLAKAVQASRHEKMDEALIEIRGVRANLSANPDTLRTAREVERYLESDDVVADLDGPNPYGIDVGLQKTLLRAVYVLTASIDNYVEPGVSDD